MAETNIEKWSNFERSAVVPWCRSRNDFAVDCQKKYACIQSWKVVEI